MTRMKTSMSTVTGALSLVMQVWGSTSKTSSRRSTVVVPWMNGIIQTQPGPRGAPSYLPSVKRTTR